MFNQRRTVRQPRQRVVPRQKTRAFLRHFVVTAFGSGDAFQHGVVRGNEFAHFVAPRCGQNKLVRPAWLHPCGQRAIAQLKQRTQHPTMKHEHGADGDHQHDQGNQTTDSPQVSEQVMQHFAGIDAHGNHRTTLCVTVPRHFQPRAIRRPRHLLNHAAQCV